MHFPAVILFVIGFSNIASGVQKRKPVPIESEVFYEWINPSGSLRMETIRKVNPDGYLANVFKFKDGVLTSKVYDLPLNDNYTIGYEGRFILAVKYDGSLNLIDGTNGKILRQLSKNSEHLYFMSQYPSFFFHDRFLLLYQKDHSIWCIDLDKSSEDYLLAKDDDRMAHEFYVDNEFPLVVQVDFLEQIIIHDVLKKKALYKLPGEFLDVDLKNRRLALLYNNVIKIFEWSDEKIILLFSQPSMELCNCKLLSDSFVYTTEKATHIFDLKSQKESFSFIYPSSFPYSKKHQITEYLWALSNNKKYFAVLVKDIEPAHVDLYDVSSGKLLYSRTINPFRFYSRGDRQFSFTDDSRFFIISPQDDDVEVFNLAENFSEKQMWKMPGSKGTLGHVTSADSSLCVLVKFFKSKNSKRKSQMLEVTIIDLNAREIVACTKKNYDENKALTGLNIDHDIVGFYIGTVFEKATVCSGPHFYLDLCPLLKA